MDGHSTAVRVLASGRFFCLTLAGLALTALVAMDVPQGVTDSAIIATYPLASGRFIALFGFNHLGSSLAVWFWVLIMVLHGAAVLVHGQPSGGKPPGNEDRALRLPAWSTALAGMLGLFALLGLMTTGLEKADPRVADTTRLAVSVMDTPGSPTRQVVEEGASYQVPDIQGERTLTFGAAGQGPYALEKDRQGTLTAHLPLVNGDDPSTLKVASRRPSALSGAGIPGGGLPKGLARSLALAAPFLVLFAGVHVLIRNRWNQGPHRAWPMMTLLVCAALLTAGPFWNVAGAPLPLSGEAGADLSYALRVVTPTDVAPWEALVPVSERLHAPYYLGMASALAAFLAFAVLPRSLPWEGTGRVLTGIAAGTTFLSGAVLLAAALARITVGASPVDMEARFLESVLPRIDMATSVLGSSLTVPGPYAVSLFHGMSAGLALTALGVLLLEATRTRPRRVRPKHRTLLISLVALLLFAGLRAAALTFSADPRPLGATPFALVAALAAALPFVMARLHPGWEAGLWTCVVIAASMQLALT